MAVSHAERGNSSADIQDLGAEASEAASARRASSASGPEPFAFLRDRLVTAPNLVTLIRTIASVVIAGWAFTLSAPWLLVLAYAVYWAGDVLDGFLARRLDQETRLGAVLDIVSDRACTAILCGGVVAFYPELALVVIPFFLSFLVLDTILSLAFLCWPLLSPNYFWRVDRVTYLLNWSPPAKAINTAGVILLAVAGLVWTALGLVLVLAAIKVWSVVRVHRLLRAHPVAEGA